MEGMWPLYEGQWGNGFDAYVLDGKGAAAIGPLPFEIKADGVVASAPASFKPNVGEMPSVSSSSSSSVPATKSETHTHGLLTHNHAFMKPSSSHHSSAVAYNFKITSASGLNGASSSAAMTGGGMGGGTSAGNQRAKSALLTSDKPEYTEDDAVILIYSMETAFLDKYKNDDMSKWSVGIFMRMADPQGGALAPIVSTPLCDKKVCEEGSVEFSYDKLDTTNPDGSMKVVSWPLDLYEYGTGYDVYILDEDGEALVGPAKFNMLMDESY